MKTIIKKTNLSMSYVYKICCKNQEIKECYVGSTNNIKRRIRDHRTNILSNNKYQLKLYDFIRKNGGRDNWEFIILEEKITPDNLPEREKFWIETFNSNLNSVVPGRTKKEYNGEGGIYKLCCKDPNIKDCYIGSTTNFILRNYQHKHATNNEKGKQYNQLIYKCIRQNGGWDNWKMCKLKVITQKLSKTELERIERSYIEREESAVNVLIPTRTYLEYQHISERYQEYQQNYRRTHIEKTEEYNRIYRKQNSDKMKEYKAKFYEANKEAIAEQAKKYREANKEAIADRNKKYYEANKEAIAEQAKKYREANKEAIAERAKQRKKEKVKCECGSLVSKGNISTHNKTIKHQNYLTSLS